jgi:uncharacterized damage-inducible protein DinB
MGREPRSGRAAVLARRLDEAARAFVAAIESVDDAAWDAVPAPGVWSIGKVAAHVAEAIVMHQWIVRRTIGETVPSRRPPIERTEMTTRASPVEMAELIRLRTREGVILLRELTDPQLDLPTRPPRARGQLLAETIEHVLIGHIHTHRAEIKEKLRAAT